MNIDPTKPLEAPNREGAPDGNQNALKFDTPEKRKALCEAYIIHKTKGYSDASFIECDMKTFKNYREKYPVDFPSEQLEAAERIGQNFWETIGIDGTQGKIKNYNSDSWKFNMSNRFKWKIREDVTTDDEKLPDTKTIILDTKPKEENG